MPTIDFTFDSEATRRAFQDLGDKIHEQVREHVMGDNRPMREVNKRPRAVEPERPVQIIRRHPPVDAHRSARAVVHVMVPNAFGRREPVLDAATGKPVDFMREFGDPEDWGRDRMGQVTEAAQRCAKTCVTILKARAG